MIDTKRVLTYCKKLNIQIEDFLFLYMLRVRSLNRRDEEFFELSNWYYSNFYFVELDGKKYPVNWKLKIEILIEKGFITAYPNWCKRLKGNELLWDIQFSKLELTDKFNEDLFTDDLEDWWSEFVLVYDPQHYTVNKDGVRESIEDLKNTFWKISNYGDRGRLFKMIEIARHYVSTTQFKLSLSNFFLEFSERERLFDSYMNTHYKTKVL